MSAGGGAIFERPAGDGEASSRPWPVRLRAPVAVIAIAVVAFAAHGAVVVSAARDALILAIDASIGLLLLGLALLYHFRVAGERRRYALIERLVESLSVPRSIDEAASAGAQLLVASGLADAAVVGVARAAGADGEAARGTQPEAASGQLVSVAGAGFDGDFESGATASPPVEIESAPTVTQRAILADPWLSQLRDRHGARPWVAQVPLARNGELLGMLVLAARRRRQLRDRALLRSVAMLFTAALDHARLYQATFERTELLEEQETRRQEFLYAIMHELRTPLTSIQAFAGLLTRERAPEGLDTRSLAGSLSRGVDRLGTLVDDLLELGRSQQAMDRVDLGAVDVAGALRLAEELLRPAFVQQQQAVTIEAAAEPLLATADERALEQVLVNLLSNANRHSPVRGVIVVRAASRDGRVRIEVEDSGPGIEPDDRERIFEPFYRVHRAGVAEMPGSGLGLAIARRCIEQQRGSIWVEAVAGGGSRFCVELDAAEAATGALSAPQPPAR